MKRYIWLGDSKFGGSVFWDKQKEICVRSNISKPRKSNRKQNTSLTITIISAVSLFRIILKKFIGTDVSEGNLSNLNMVFFTTVFSLTFIVLLYFSFFGVKKDYVETTLEDGIHGIKSTGYLDNSLIFMAVNKNLKRMVYSLIILSSLFGILQSVPKLNQLSNIIRICFMVLYLLIPIYIVYLVNFKKENKLKL